LIPRKVRRYLAQARVARLATLNEDNTIHVVPIAFANDSNSLYFAIDNKPKKTRKNLKRVRNIKRTGTATVLFDNYSEDWENLSYAIIYTKARTISSETKRRSTLSLLRRKYPQYRDDSMLPFNSILVELTPGRIVRWTAKTAQK
jgi:PPOX class probable F420-dependent enzyme